MDDFNKLEEDLKTQDAEKKKAKHKVSGRSIFEIKKIIENKVVENKKDGDGSRKDAKKSVAGEK